jgi:hypothetical protein
VLDHPVDEEAIPEVSRDASRRRVRVREQPLLFEHGQLIPHGRRRDLHRRTFDQGLRADRRPRGHVLLHDQYENLLLARREHEFRGRRHL